MVKPSPAFEVVALRAFRDNYIWCLQNSRYAAVVDPGDAEPVIAHLRSTGLQLIAVLATHHHADHVGGAALLSRQYSVPVYGPAGESIAAMTHPLRECDQLRLAELDAAFDVLDIPGHTAGHIAYVGHGLLFCGDTLFSVGCGRLFEGTPEQMTTSLDKLAGLPGSTKMYCGHEYTTANIKFALAVEPGNTALRQRLAEVDAALAQGKPSLPSRISDELDTNPFLRTLVPDVAAAAARHANQSLPDRVAVFAALRAWKNTF